MIDTDAIFPYAVLMVEHKIQAAAIKKLIESSNRILVVAHKKPDGDTLGASCAWWHYLTDLGKEVDVFCRDAIPSNLQHLPGSQYIQNDHLLFDKQYDLIIVNDSGDLEYAGIDQLIASTINSQTKLINIDHHITNPHYGLIDLVIPTSSSTTEIVARLFLQWDNRVTKPIAECLLYGIISDTDGLSNPATTYTTLVIAAELVHNGANMNASMNRFLYSRSINDLRVWGNVLSRLKHNQEYGIITTYVLIDDLKKHDTDHNSVEGISNFLTLIPDVNAVLVLTELDNEYMKGSLRSIHDHIDVGYLALQLGGGGHQKASGFRVRGRIKIQGENWTIV